MSSTEADINLRYYGTRQLGREHYWRYMAAPRFRSKVILGLLRECEARSIVDLGCGNGLLLAEIARARPATLAGVDASSYQIEANRIATPQVEWRCADVQGDVPASFPLAARFDVVVASELIEHLDRPERMLQFAHALAAPGHGRLLLSTQSGPLRPTERFVGHTRHYSAEEMDALLRKCQWEPIRIWNAGYPFHDLSKWYANRDPERSMRRFGDRGYGPVERAVCLLLRALFRLNSSQRGAQLFAVARRCDR